MKNKKTPSHHNKIVGINLLFLIPGEVGGSEPYSRRLIDALYKYDKNNEYVLFCNKENFNTFDKKYNRVLIPLNATNRPLRLLVEQLVLPFYLLFNKIDILFSLGYISPFFTHCKSIVNIFDLNWYYHPEDFGLLQRILWKFFVTNSARFADAITTSSYSSKKSIEKVLGFNKKIEVINSGLPVLKTIKKDIIEVKTHKPYFFSLSAAYPHKNLITLLKAHQMLLEKGMMCNLLIAGLGGRSNDELDKFLDKNRKFKKYVKRLGYVTDNKMTALYLESLALVFPSTYEGFGVPVVEAYSLGVPVISSNAFSLKEVVGNGGVLISPYNYQRFSNEMEKVLLDNSYRKELIKKSKNGAKRFNWVLSVNKIVSFLDIVVSF